MDTNKKDENKEKNNEPEPSQEDLLAALSQHSVNKMTQKQKIEFDSHGKIDLFDRLDDWDESP